MEKGDHVIHKCVLSILLGSIGQPAFSLFIHLQVPFLYYHTYLSLTYCLNHTTILGPTGLTLTFWTLNLTVVQLDCVRQSWQKGTRIPTPGKREQKVQAHLKMNLNLNLKTNHNLQTKMNPKKSNGTNNKPRMKAKMNLWLKIPNRRLKPYHKKWTLR